MLEEAIAKINSGNCILFTGSGFSYGLPSFLGDNIPQVGTLTEIFLDIAEIKEDREDYDLETASSAAFNGSEDKAFEYIQRAFRCKASDDARCAISRAPWRRVYTANYDDVFEQSRHSIGLPYTSLTIADAPSDFIQNNTQIVHIHGSIVNLSKENFRNIFYLTDEQSRDIEFDRSNWRRFFLDDLTYSDAAFFVGFSNSDFHIRRLLDAVRHLSSKIFFITSSQFSAPARGRIRAYGQYCPIGVDSFSSKISLAPPEDTSILQTPSCFITVNFPRETEKLAARDDVYAELLLGTIDELNFAKSDIGGYYVDRVSCRNLDAILLRSGLYVFIADVGNGKTALVNQLAAKCFRRGRKILRFSARRFEMEVVRNFILMNPGSVYIVENISFNYDIVKLIQDADRKALILCTDRTKKFELSVSDLRKNVKEMNILDINKFNVREVKNFISFLDHNILWGDSLLRQTSDSKIYHIQNRCGLELRGLLFSLFEGGSVHKRISDIFEQFTQLSDELHDLIILNCLLNYAYTRNSLDRHIYNMEDLLDIRIDFARSRQEVGGKDISEFIDIEHGRVGFRSSIFAKYYLNKMVDIDYTMHLVFRVMRNLETTFKKYEEDLYFDFSKALMQYNLYREIYSRNSARDGRLTLSREKFDLAIEKFYDKCRVLSISVGNPLFIIQISMASMDRGDFRTCENLIASARSICRPGWDQYHIDTHHAEVLIKRSMRDGLSQNLNDESLAYSMLRSVVERRNERYHPFGILDLLINLFEVRWSTLSKIDRETVVSFVSGITKLAERFPDEIRDKYHIVMRVNQRADRFLNRVRQHNNS